MGIETIRTEWITLADGTRLAATLWLPEGPGPHPAVLEFLPYRRGDGTVRRDLSTYPAFARAGIAGVRVDSRGQGDSEGLFDDEYSPQELADAAEVIGWIAARDWSNGAVGMMGISWGGFNALQVAALRPPALKAVISLASTADRYNDDIHYKGGCLLSANVSWAGTMLSFTSRPPDPEVVGNRWAEIWRERLAAMPMLLETWLSHQHRDAYWKHGSICEDWGAIQCPVWVIAGYGDGYRNTPATIARGLEAPVRAMTGPWVHKYPHFAWPQPRADFLGLAVDWWKHWLAGEERGVADWPAHRAFRIEGARPSAWRGRDAGAWLAAEPGPVREFALGDRGRLGGGASVAVEIATPQHCGTAAGEYFALKPDAEMPADQRPDDALSACWESGVLEAPLDILGRPEVRARVAIDRPQGNLIARLVDVHPDGTAALICRGVLNLCHRDSQENPSPMVPGEAAEIALVLDETCYRLRPGHRLRLALSTAYWPLVLPSPAAVTATVLPGARLAVPGPGASAEIEVPEPADPAPQPEFPVLEAGHARRWVEHDLTGARVRYCLDEDSGLEEAPGGMAMRETRAETWEIDPSDPEGAEGRLEFTSTRARGGWECRTRSIIRMTCRAEVYEVEAEQTAWEGETEFHTKRWAFTVPRRCV